MTEHEVLMIERRCQQCFGLMRIDISLEPTSDCYAVMCHHCTDKPIGEITDGTGVGEALEVNQYQLKPY